MPYGKKKLSVLLILFCSFLSFPEHFVQAKTVNPIAYGLLDATTGEEKYQVLLKAHMDAVTNGYDLSYKGIKRIEIDIPENARSIPLPLKTDFAGVEIIVSNRAKNIHLFLLQGEKQSISIDKTTLGTGNFRSIPELKSGDKVLIIEDNYPWIKQREGYDYGVTRKDILYVRKGIAQNSPIQTYNNDISVPVCSYFNSSKRKTTIENLVFVRTEESSKETYLINIRYMDNVVIRNVKTITPESEMYADILFTISDCTNIQFEDILINGTYSQTNKYGYGFYMNNVWNSRFLRLKAKGNWGIFGNYNICEVTIKDSEINRFDVHCYGKDIKSIGCKFSDLYNQFSSIYGAIVFTKCVFNNFTPVLIESSFNAYTPFELKWTNCVFYLDEKHNYLLTLFGVPEPYNERPELRRKCLPNISVKNCTIHLTDDMEKWYLIQTGGVRYRDSFDYVNQISLNRIKVYGSANAMFSVSTEKLRTSQLLKVGIKKSNIKYER